MNQSTCKIDGCDEPHKARGWCVKHYQRWRKHGSPSDRPRPSAARSGRKRCNECGVTQPLSAFYRRSGKPGYISRCKPCHSAHQAARYKHDPERARIYYLANRERVLSASRAWSSDNADRRNEYKMRRRAHLRTNIPAGQIKARMEYFGNRCWMCGGNADTVDHVKPISKGGAHLLANLRPACRRCNSGKSGRWFGALHLDRFIRN